jgi:hypothetical protein
VREPLRVRVADEQHAASPAPTATRPFWSSLTRSATPWQANPRPPPPYSSTGANITCKASGRHHATLRRKKITAGRPNARAHENQSNRTRHEEMDNRSSRTALHDRTYRRPLLGCHDCLCERKSPRGSECRDRRSKRRPRQQCRSARTRRCTENAAGRLGRGEQLTVRQQQQTRPGRQVKR